MKQTEPYVMTLGISMPLALREWLLAKTNAEERSMNWMVVDILKREMERENEANA